MFLKSNNSGSHLYSLICLSSRLNVFFIFFQRFYWEIYSVWLFKNHKPNKNQHTQFHCWNHQPTSSSETHPLCRSTCNFVPLIAGFHQALNTFSLQNFKRIIPVNMINFKLSGGGWGFRSCMVCFGFSR